MNRFFRTTLPALAVLAFAAGTTAHAQFYEFAQKRLHLGSIALGGSGQFSTLLEQNPQGGTANYLLGGRTLTPTAVSNEQQYTTDSAGFVASFGLQPAKWAGLELNYGFTHNSERYAFNYAIAPTTTQTATVPTDIHEFTGAYLIHPKHVPFQPFVGVGGGALDFSPRNASNQWRGAGLLEAGFDIKTRNPHLGFRLEGRSLYYRSPNFYQPAISTRSWRVTEEPVASAYFAF